MNTIRPPSGPDDHLSSWDNEGGAQPPTPPLRPAAWARKLTSRWRPVVQTDGPVPRTRAQKPTHIPTLSRIWPKKK